MLMFLINLGYALYSCYDYIFVMRYGGDGLKGDLLCNGMFYVAIVQ